jgi:integrase
VRLGGYPTRPDAEAMLARLQAPSGPRRATAVSCTTGRWLASWLAARQTLGPSARRSYQQHLNDYLIPGIGSIPLALLTPADVRAMFAAISRRRTQAGTLLSAATMVRIRCTLRAALNAAIREGLITANPARLVELPAPTRPLPVVWTVPRVAAWRQSGVRPAVAVWTAAQTAAFLTAIRDEPLYACYQLLAVSGLRRGEAAGLGWPDIDLDGATVTVTRQLQEIGGSLIVLPPKSIASNRVIALDPWTVQELRGYRDRHPPARPGGYVFARPGGRPYTPGHLTRRFIKLVRREHLPPVRLHDLRHGAATLALTTGADLKVIQAMLGHASIVLTADTYTSVLPDVARKSVEAVAAEIVRAGKLPPGLTTAPPWPHPAAA